VNLTRKDFLMIASIIHKKLYDVYPNLQQQFEFFMGKIQTFCGVLNLPVVWSIPNGSELTLNYLDSIVHRVGITFGRKHTSLSFLKKEL
jgi:hypothetical protein